MMYIAFIILLLYIKQVVICSGSRNILQALLSSGLHPLVASWSSRVWQNAYGGEEGGVENDWVTMHI